MSDTDERVGACTEQCTVCLRWGPSVSEVDGSCLDCQLEELSSLPYEVTSLRARVAELERALDCYGDYSRHGDAIRRALARWKVKR